MYLFFSVHVKSYKNYYLEIGYKTRFLPMVCPLPDKGYTVPKHSGTKTKYNYHVWSRLGNTPLRIMSMYIV